MEVWKIVFHSILEILHSIPFWHLPHSIPKFPFHSIPFSIPFHTIPRVEVSHANAYARAIAFFSYIWFKYDILSLHCCKLRTLRCVVVSTLKSRPSAPGFNSQIGCANVIQYAGTWNKMYKAIFFASKPCITVRIGGAMPA